MEDNCFSYHPLPVCGFHGTCEQRNREFTITRAESYRNDSSSWHCQCEPGWSQTWEASPFFEIFLVGREDVYGETEEILKKLPCIQQVNVLYWLYVAAFIALNVSLVLCTRLCMYRRRKIGLEKQEYFQLFSLFAGLSLLSIAALLRIHDFENRIIIADYLVSTVLTAGWCFNKISQDLFFWKYIEYNMNPIRLPFVTERSERMFPIVKRLRLLVIPWVVFPAVGLTILGAVNGGYTVDAVKLTVISYCVPSIYHAVCGWFLFTNIINDIESIIELPVSCSTENEQDRQSKLRKRQNELRWQRNQIVVYALVNTPFLLMVAVLDVFFTGTMYLAPLMSIQFALKSPRQLKYDWNAINISKELALRICTCKSLNDCSPALGCLRQGVSFNGDMCRGHCVTETELQRGDKRQHLAESPRPLNFPPKSPDT